MDRIGFSWPQHQRETIKQSSSDSLKSSHKLAVSGTGDNKGFKEVAFWPGKSFQYKTLSGRIAKYFTFAQPIFA